MVCLVVVVMVTKMKMVTKTVATTVIYMFSVSNYGFLMMMKVVKITGDIVKCVNDDGDCGDEDGDDDSDLNI